VIGILILLVRGFISVGVLAFAEGEVLGASISYAASMALAACSILALAFVTRGSALGRS
jgi:hypothetical protein